MQVITRANDIRTSTRKVRLIADAVRAMGVFEALDALSVLNKKGARDLEKVLKSAVANAQNNAKLEKGNLRIAAIDINEGAFLKRYRPSTRGRIHPYKKRTTNIRIVLEEKAPAVSASLAPKSKSEAKETKVEVSSKEKKEEKK